MDSYSKNNPKDSIFPMCAHLLTFSVMLFLKGTFEKLYFIITL